MEDMTEDEVRRFVSQANFGHLGLAREGDAYVVPLFFGYDGRRFYFHSHPGKKHAFMETTDEACLTVSRVQSEDVWASVMAFGRIDEVTDPDERLIAMDALLSVPFPPEFGVSSEGEPKRTSRNMRIHRLSPVRMTGRMSERQPAESRGGVETGILGM